MIQTDDGLVIAASTHAARKALARIPELAGWQHHDAVYWCENHALADLKAGRRARTCPRWCVRVWANGFSRRKKAPKRGGMSRFVWDEAQTYVLLLTRFGKGSGAAPDQWIVVTVMTPEMERTLLATADPALV